MTYHQSKNPPRQLWHETKWTVVTDAPNKMMTLYLTYSEEDAIHYMKTQSNSYVLPPGLKQSVNT